MKILVRQVVRSKRALSRLPKLIMLMSLISVFSVTANVSHASMGRNTTAREILNLSVNRLVEAAATVSRTYAEITYDDASLDKNLGSLMISEIFIKPMYKSLPDGCDIRVGGSIFQMYASQQLIRIL